MRPKDVRLMAAILLVTGRATTGEEAIALAESTIATIARQFAESEGAQAAEDAVATGKGKLC